MSFRVIVCGSSGGYAGAGKACAGFLLQDEGRSVMLDLGAGALSNMLKNIEAEDLDGLAISHLHYDHYGDIYGLCTARRFWAKELEPLGVIAPSTAMDVIGSPLSEESRPEFFKCARLSTPELGRPAELGGFTITAGAARHVIDSFAFRVAAGGSTLCYSGDTEATDELVDLARGADLLICEATFTSEVDAKAPGHMFAAEAGRVASEAGVSRLVLTHLWPTLDPDRAIEDAAEAYDGPLELATEGMAIYVGPYPCAV